ncbi:MAG: serine/threonine-protein phosphatase [Acidobacteriia bacterium]|nr:serine/threonine-protein phosphatase [Terriglobia bacterium]
MPVEECLRIRPDVEVANLSDVGCERTGNEDYFLYFEPQDDGEFERRGRLIVVTDGMGGQSGGEVAGRLAAETVRDTFMESDSADPREVLIAGFRAAQQAILELAAETPLLRGMGATCCAAILQRGRMQYAHVGDSRIYVIRNGAAQPLTEDHSLVARRVRDGILTPEEAENHEDRHVLTAALGMDSESLEGDFPVEPYPLEPGDIVLLSTDGLHGIVSDREIARIAHENSPQDACRELVALAKQRGGPDNITVQLLAVRLVER